MTPSRGAPLLALLLYGLAAVVLPGLHLLYHDAAHDHGGGGIHRHAPLFKAHAAPIEAGAYHGHTHRAPGPAPAPRPDAAPDAGEPEPPAAPSEHAGGSLAHFACLYVALLLLCVVLRCTALLTRRLPPPPPDQLTVRLDHAPPPPVRGPPLACAT